MTGLVKVCTTELHAGNVCTAVSLAINCTGKVKLAAGNVEGEILTEILTERERERDRERQRERQRQRETETERQRERDIDR